MTRVPLAPSTAQAIEAGVRGAFETLFGVQPTLTAARPTGTEHLPAPGEANVLLGFAGGLNGQLLLGMSEAMACRLAGTLLMTEMTAFDEVVRSGVAELGNMVAGACATALADSGVRLNITVPAVLSGRDLHITWPHLVVSEYVIGLPFGELRLAVGLKPDAR